MRVRDSFIKSPRAAPSQARCGEGGHPHLVFAGHVQRVQRQHRAGQRREGEVQVDGQLLAARRVDGHRVGQLGRGEREQLRDEQDRHQRQA